MRSTTSSLSGRLCSRMLERTEYAVCMKKRADLFASREAIAPQRTGMPKRYNILPLFPREL